LIGLSLQLSYSHANTAAVNSLDVDSESSVTLTLVSHRTAGSQPTLVTPSHSSYKRSHSLDRDTTTDDGYIDVFGRKS